MYSSDGVGLEILSEGRSLPFFDDPEARDEDGNGAERRTRSVYTEAVTGAKSQVKVTIQHSYDVEPLSSDGGILLDIDFDNIPGWSIYWSQEEVSELRGAGKSVEHTFINMKHFDASSGRWIQGGLKFSALTMCKYLATNM